MVKQPPNNMCEETTSLIIQTWWNEIPGNMVACSNCGDCCYTKAYQAMFQIEQSEPQQIKRVLCEPCFALMKETHA